MKIDAHQHYWKLQRGDYGWLAPELAELYRDFGPEELKPALEASGIGRSIAVQAAPTIAETEYLLALCLQESTLAGVVGWVDLEDERVEERLDSLLSSGYLLGIRPMLQDLPDDRHILRPAVLKGLQAVADRGLTLDLLVRPRHLLHAAEMLDRVASLRAVVDHIGKPDMERGDDRGVWEEGMAALAANSRTACKLSGLVTEAGSAWSPELIAPYTDRAVSLFGPRRLLYGSDWPVCLPFAGYAEVLKLADRLLPKHWGPSEKEAVMGGNAMEWYPLKE
ncbi:MULTISPECIES: amidohydrolase family protein [unclassified Paenibacillus]|uniref:amidohydrolase family protein n=1 Tax=unclassified Paenibacillus TaxID=185978 RepID=UPI0009541F84|nr:MULTISPECIES: amidohydrolase family protein [unclassified Paenibacillus]ASS66814.1 amidohydrolase family protein [Paenibacillus sp. RUD330]SIP94555.1 L-fuconolactonase [Paenibacillus sp. RU4X]SIQ12984.1 L-fuconolactonase [Paenibacillus sp. RU4T]